MGYRISYELGRRNRSALWEINVAAGLGLALLIFAVTIRLFQPETADSVRQQLLPEATTVMAWLEDLELSDSVQAFCRDILHGE